MWLALGAAVGTIAAVDETKPIGGSGGTAGPGRNGAGSGRVDPIAGGLLSFAAKLLSAILYGTRWQRSREVAGPRDTVPPSDFSVTQDIAEGRVTSVMLLAPWEKECWMS